MKLTEYEKLALDKLGQSVINGKLSNAGLVQLIEHAASFMNLKSIQEYADTTGKTYNGIKKTKEITVILGQKYIIDND